MAGYFSSSYFGIGYWHPDYFPEFVAAGGQSGEYWHRDYWANLSGTAQNTAWWAQEYFKDNQTYDVAVDAPYWGAGYWRPGFWIPNWWADTIAVVIDYRTIEEAWSVALAAEDYTDIELVVDEDWDTGLSETTSTLVGKTIADTWNVLVAESLLVAGASPILVSLADTWSVSIADAAAASTGSTVPIVVTDTWSASLTENLLSVEVAAGKYVAENWNASLTQEAVGFQSFDALVQKSIADGWALTWTDEGDAAVSNMTPINLTVAYLPPVITVTRG